MRRDEEGQQGTSQSPKGKPTADAQWKVTGTGGPQDQAGALGYTARVRKPAAVGWI